MADSINAVNPSILTMAKRSNPRISSPFSSSLVSAKAPGSVSVSWPSICEYPIASLAVYRELPSYSSIMILSIVVMVSLVMLCALRENTSESNAEFDSRPFVRYIKKNILGTSDGLVVATALAVVPALGLIDVSTPVQVENFMKACIANYRPNVKAPKQLNSSNVEVWVNGQISRILGLMNSCPASVAGLYNFGLSPGQSTSYTAENIVRSIPLPNKASWQYIIWSFRIILGRGRVKRDSNGITSLTGSKPLVFNESPIAVTRNSSRNNSLGITQLESQMFTLELVTRDGRTTPGIEIKRELDPSTLTFSEEKPKVRSLDMQELETFLTSLELASYRSAYKLGNKSRLISLNQTAASRKAQAESQQLQPQAIKPEDAQISLGEFAKQTSSFKKRGRPKSVDSSPPSSGTPSSHSSQRSSEVLSSEELDNRAGESVKSIEQPGDSSVPGSSDSTEALSQEGSASNE